MSPESAYELVELVVWRSREMRDFDRGVASIPSTGVEMEGPNTTQLSTVS